MATQKKDKSGTTKTAKKAITFEKPKKDGFPIVGIGASAGGLEALQEFFDGMPSSPGAAFVIVQHLSPDYKSFMGELLARHTSIPIDIVTDNVTIEIDHIYLIPPKMNMTIAGGKLHLKEIEGRALNLPIDIFFRSLAADQENNAIGIILSGTGSDGTLGIRAIKENGGMTMVQDDQTAKFDGMPRSSISTGMVDLVLSPSLLAEELANYIKHPFINKNIAIESQLLQNQSVFNKIIATLHDAKNVDFSNYKQNTLIRRLEKRISINRFEKVTDYVSYLTITPKEISALFNDMLIGVTRFFRDEKAFEMLASAVIPDIFEQHSDKSEIRIWCPACSTGEEAYTLAILFKEYMTKNNVIKDIKIFATDIDEESLAYAGTGLYPSNITADVPGNILAKHFIRKDAGYQINDNIRRMIIFARHNIIDEPPFSKLDLISCRNLLIYLNIDVQQKILGTFHVCLKNDGYMFLGSSESLGKLAEGFDIIDSKSKLFRKRNRYKPEFLPISSLNTPLHRNRSEMMHAQSATNLLKSGSKQLNSFFEDVAQAFLPPSVIVDAQCNVLYTIHDVGKYLQLPKGQITTNLLKMLQKDASVIVSSVIRRSDKKEDGVIGADLTTANISDGTPVELTVTCHKFSGDDYDFPYYLVSFEERPVIIKGDKESPKNISLDINTQYQERIDELEREIQHKNESLQATVEELETSNEELQSSNEELIASNEELQSTNEELQSVNEELYTVNSEHIRKIEELTELNSDYDNLLKNTYIGNLFLDKNLVIRKVSEVATQITNVLASDIGRPIQHLALKSMYPGFLNDIEKVSDTLEPVEKEIHFTEQKWYFMRVMPYRTKDNAVDGIIITFVDISGLKRAQSEVLAISERLSKTFSLGEIFWWEWDIEKDIIATGQSIMAILGYRENEIGITSEKWNMIVHPDDRDARNEAISNCLSGKSERYNCEYRLKTKKGNYIYCRDKGGVVLTNQIGKPIRFSGIIMNISREKER
ncbi:MAG: chemotaxis protein CheB [Bacteroidales bacterium]|nr:chemotaxis protein CheB [Bacteroidales bacterium]MDD4670747.1 chemotaxis protein CheB [Bacteroidales bacterium]